MIQILGRKSITAVLVILMVLAGSISVSASWPHKKKKKEEATKKAAAPAAEIKPTPPPAPPTPPANGSLFTDSAPGTTLVTNFKAQHVGDLVFIDVVETSTATVSSSADRSRDSGTIGGLSGGIAALPNPGTAVAGVIVGLGVRKYDGKGATQRQSALKSRITARVVEVLPNGDLRIEANKLVKINKEDETLSLSGIVRQRDVSADNAIPSTAVGDLKLALNGKGVASADNQPGWLFRLIDKVSPF
jgi:flagellar L-ring protein precursor FlgH